MRIRSARRERASVKRFLRSALTTLAKIAHPLSRHSRNVPDSFRKFVSVTESFSPGQ
jgi:hypothetical protein